MNYGCTVWGYAGGNVLNVIHRLENKSARAIACNYDYINVRGDDICKGLGLTRFQTRRYYFTPVLMFYIYLYFNCFTLFYNNIALRTVCFIGVFTLFISVHFIALMSLFYNNVAFITTFTLSCHPCTLKQSFD